MTERWERRERKQRKRRGDDMLVSGRSIKSVLLPVIAKRARTSTEKQDEHLQEAPARSRTRGNIPTLRALQEP